MSNLFSEEQTTAQTPPQGDDVLATKLSAIVNEEGKQKYADINTALDALKTSQEFIPDLKHQVLEKDNEILKLREELAKQVGVQETLEKYATQHKAQPQTTEETPTDSLGTQDIESLVQNVFKQHLEQTEAEKNLEQVHDALVAAYGDQASNHIAKTAKDLSTTKEQLESLARTNPTLVLKLLGSTEKDVKPAGGSTITTDTLQMKDTGLEPPKQSLLWGATHSEVSDYMKKIREDVYKKHGITQ
jgi:hypothetical protein